MPYADASNDTTGIGFDGPGIAARNLTAYSILSIPCHSKKQYLVRIQPHSLDHISMKPCRLRKKPYGPDYSCHYTHETFFVLAITQSCTMKSFKAIVLASVLAGITVLGAPIQSSADGIDIARECMGCRRTARDTILSAQSERSPQPAMNELERKAQQSGFQIDATNTCDGCTNSPADLKRARSVPGTVTPSKEQRSQSIEARGGDPAFCLTVSKRTSSCNPIPLEK